MSHNKLRERTPKDLDRQGQYLSEVYEILVSNNVNPLISGGTLLGIIREGDFIKWDWDIELSVKYSEVRNKNKALLDALKKKGYSITKYRPGKLEWKIEVEKKNVVFEIRGWYRKNDLYKRSFLSIPAEFLDKEKQIEFRDTTYQIPESSRSYLDFVYGDWETPKKTSVKSEYFNNTFYTPNNFIKQCIRVKLIFFRVLNFPIAKFHLK